MSKEYLPKSTPMSERERSIAESCNYLLRHSDGRKTPLWYIVNSWKDNALADSTIYTESENKNV